MIFILTVSVVKNACFFIPDFRPWVYALVLHDAIVQIGPPEFIGVRGLSHPFKPLFLLLLLFCLVFVGCCCVVCMMFVVQE